MQCVHISVDLLGSTIRHRRKIFLIKKKKLGNSNVFCFDENRHTFWNGLHHNFIRFFFLLAEMRPSLSSLASERPEFSLPIKLASDWRSQEVGGKRLNRKRFRRHHYVFILFFLHFNIVGWNGVWFAFNQMTWTAASSVLTEAEQLQIRQGQLS